MAKFIERLLSQIQSLYTKFRQSRTAIKTTKIAVVAITWIFFVELVPLVIAIMELALDSKKEKRDED